MKLNADQRRNMLLPIWIAGRDIPEKITRCTNHPAWPQEYETIVIGDRLGDLLYAQRALLLSDARKMGHKAVKHAERVVKELLGIDLGAGTDEATKQAFAEAKIKYTCAIPDDPAWPEWYRRGKKPSR